MHTIQQNGSLKVLVIFFQRKQVQVRPSQQIYRSWGLFRLFFDKEATLKSQSLLHHWVS